MSATLPSVPRTLPGLNWQLAGAGRTTGALSYLDPVNGRVHELVLARLVHAGHDFSTVVFDNPAIPPARIAGNPAQHGLQVGSKVLAELRFAGPGDVSIQRWFHVGKAKPAPQVKPNPVPSPTPARTTGVVINVSPDFRYAFAEVADSSRVFIPSKACRFPLRMNMLVSFRTAPSASGPLPEAIDVRLASAA